MIRFTFKTAELGGLLYRSARRKNPAVLDPQSSELNYDL